MEQTAHEQRMYDHYKKNEDENFHLKQQLHNKNKELKNLRKQFNNVLRKNKKRKPRYKNSVFR